MNYDTNPRRAADARVLNMVFAIANKANWPLERAGTALSPAFAGYLYAPAAELLLVPTRIELIHMVPIVDTAVREARADALIVCAKGETVSFALGLWRSTGTRWHAPVAPMMTDDGKLWMIAGVPMTHHAAPAGTAFRLQRRRILEAAAPWSSTLDRFDGERRAANWLAGLLVSSRADAEAGRLRS